ncbi:MAG: T9SS type A sorting domain-containing protein, partial [Bacteroidota bacterium]
TASGGPAGTCLPAWSDNVVFDAGSGLAAGTVTVNVTSGCNNFTWSVNNSTLAGNSYDLYVGGNFTLVAGMTLNFGSGMGNNSLIFNSNNPGNIITLAGKTVWANIEFNGSGSWSLAGNMNCGRSIYLHKGNLNTNNFALSFNSFYSQTTAVRQLSLGNQTHTLSGNYYLTDGTNFTMNAGTSTLSIAGNYFNGGDKIYNIVNMSTNGYCNILGNNTFTTLSIPNSKNVSLEGGKTQTTTNLTLLSGTDCNNYNNLYSDNPGTPASIAKAGAGLLLNFMNISDVTSTGAAMLTANNSVGIGNVTGWTINPPLGATHYWVGGTGDWNQNIHWSASSGGPGGLCIPTSLDDVVFDANSFLIQSTVTLNITGYCKSMNWTGAAFNPLFNINGDLNINGSLTFIPVMDIQTFSTVKFISSTPVNTITTAGKSLYSISFNGTGTYGLQDNLNFSYINFNNGTLNTNNFTLIGGSNATFTSNSTSLRTLNLGSSNIQLQNWDITDPTNLTINAGTSEILMNNNPWQFRGGNKAYHDVTIQPSSFGGSTTIYGSNSFATLKFSAGCDIRFESGKTQTTTDLDATGDPGNLISLSAYTAGNFSSISQATPFCGDYLDIKDLHVAGTTFYAGNNSNNLGGNLGWTWSGMIANDQYPASLCETVAGGGTVSGINLTTWNAAIDGGTGCTHTWYSDAGLTTLVPVPTNVTVSNGLTFYDLVNNGTCTKVAIIVFTVTPIPVLSFVVTNVSCFGGNNGAINLSVSTGTAPFTFLWSDGAITEDISGLTIGTYGVTVTDANGCSNTGSATVAQPTQIFLSTVVTNVACFGGNNGAVNLIVAGGVSPYTYLWTGGLLTEDISGLTAGTYNVTVTDNNGCTATSSATVAQPTQIFLSTVVTNVACFGGNNGAVNLVVAGGVGPYTYLWTGGLLTEDISGLTAGTYNVTVTDFNLCTATTSATVVQPVVLNATITNTVNLLCNNIPNGSSTVTPVGGTMPYSYLWDDGQTDSTAVGLHAGIYSVTVTDNNGCTVISTDTISEPTAMIITTHGYDAVCGLSNGSASVDVNGATPPYVYLWDDIPGSTTDSISNLPAGIYTVTVTDFNLCTSTASVVISNIGGPVIDSIEIVDVTCSGDCDGTAAVTISSGSGTYTISWSNGVTGVGTSITGLCAANYSVTVTDNISGCATIELFTISAPLPLSLIMSSTDDHGTGDGTATVTVSGGVPPYTYLWNDPLNQNTQTASSLVNGTYSVTVTDANMCTASNMVNVLLNVGVATIDNGFNASLFPNPTSSEINLKISNNSGNENVHILITNNLGEIVFSRKELVLKGNNLFNFDLSKTAPGLYYVRLTPSGNDNFKEIRFKVVKTE